MPNIFLVRSFYLVIFLLFVQANWSRPLVPGGLPPPNRELIIKYHSTATAKDIRWVTRLYGFQRSLPVSSSPLKLVHLYSSFPDTVVSKCIAQNPLVEICEPNAQYALTVIPNDPLFNRQWGLHNTRYRQGKFNADIDAPETWKNQRGSRKIVIGVIDSGIDYYHPDLKDNTWKNPGEIPNNGRDDDNNGFIDDHMGWNFYDGNNDIMDNSTHGTHVSGILGAVANDNFGMAGICWEISIMPVKCFSPNGFGFVSDIVPAINYAVDNGAHIINASFGAYFASAAMREAIIYARDKGVIFIAAAGNHEKNTDVNPFYPACYGIENLISVAATNPFDEPAHFTNYGANTISLAAPGEEIISTIPGGKYDTYKGTSMAAPYVCGVAGLMLSQNPSLTHKKINPIMLESTDYLPILAGKVKTSGRLNAARSMAAVKKIKRPVPDYVIKYFQVLFSQKQ